MLLKMTEETFYEISKFRLRGTWNITHRKLILSLKRAALSLLTQLFWDTIIVKARNWKRLQALRFVNRDYKNSEGVDQWYHGSIGTLDQISIATGALGAMWCGFGKDWGLSFCGASSHSPATNNSTLEPLLDNQMLPLQLSSLFEGARTMKKKSS